MKPCKLSDEEKQHLVICVNNIKAQKGHLVHQLLPLFKKKFPKCTLSYKSLRNAYDYLANKEVK